MSDFARPTPFVPRPVTPRGVVTVGGWRLKRYDIRIPGGAFDEPAYEDGLAQLGNLLPKPPVTSERPGVGFVICHQGATRLYLVVNWWDNQNELFQRVLIRDVGADSWRDGAGLGSFCVWDAEVIWHERTAYVEHVLSGKPDLDAYMSDAVRLGE